MSIHYDVPWSDYLTWPQMNPSTLKHGAKSMLRLRRAIEGECKPAIINVAVGNAVHCIIAGELEERYSVMPAFENHTANCTATGAPSTSKATKFYKEQSAIWRLENEGKEELNEVQLHTAVKVANLVRKRAGRLIDESKQEVVLTGEICGVEMKTRLDGLILNGPNATIWDLKTTSDISDAAFFRIFDRLGYGFSASVHVELLKQNGYEMTEYLIIAAEVQDDYDVRIITVPLQLMDNVISKVKEIATAYRIAKENDCWPGLPDAPLSVSNWAMDQWESENELQWKT